MHSALDALDQYDAESTTKFLHAPFGYPGSKLRSLKTILPLLPYASVYVEPFGGSASVLLNRKPSKLEVFNDRFAGVVAFYRCMREKELTERLVAWIDNTIHSKEDFVTCKQTWENVSDPVERAGRWLYLVSYSFSGVGRNWGRARTAAGALSGKLVNNIDCIWAVHDRFKHVQVENQSWYDCMTYYDQPEAVFYVDPPYMNTDKGTYRHDLTNADHAELLRVIFTMKAFVAVSGYKNPLYDNQPWDDAIEYKVLVTAKNNNANNPNKGREYVTEMLWIKEYK